MKTAGHGAAARTAGVVLALCALNSGCLVISWDWSGRKGEDHKAVCRSSSVEAFDADPAVVRQACHHALQGLAMPVNKEAPDGSNLEAANKDQEKVTIAFKRENAPGTPAGGRTVVDVRMTTKGDGTESRQILQQVEAYLAGVTATAQRPNPVVQAVATQPEAPAAKPE